MHRNCYINAPRRSCADAADARRGRRCCSPDRSPVSRDTPNRRRPASSPESTPRAWRPAAPPLTLPADTMLGALCRYISTRRPGELPADERRVRPASRGAVATRGGSRTGARRARRRRWRRLTAWIDADGEGALGGAGAVKDATPYDRAVARFLAYLRGPAARLAADAARLRERPRAVSRRSSPSATASALPGPEAIDALAIRGLRGPPPPRRAREVVDRAQALRGALVPASTPCASGVIDASPAEGIPTPKQPKLLPKNLTVDEVFTLLDGIAGDDVAARRDRALLEFLYATGLAGRRAGLARSRRRRPAGGLVRVLGKGNKERIVPFGRKAAGVAPGVAVRIRAAAPDAAATPKRCS